MAVKWRKRKKKVCEIRLALVGPVATYIPEDLQARHVTYVYIY